MLSEMLSTMRCIHVVLMHHVDTESLTYSVFHIHTFLDSLKTDATRVPKSMPRTALDFGEEM
jgi:hypothetical protein